MKKLFFAGKALFVALFLTVSTNSCTDLTEKTYDVLKTEDFKTESEIVAVVGAAYTNLYSFMNHNTIFSIQEVSSDEMAIPHRGADWFDGGQWLRMHRHEYTPKEESFNNAWQFCYKGISNCNRIIEQLETADKTLAAKFVSELKVLRALYYYYLVDLYGNVPVVTAFAKAEAKPANRPRAEVAKFVEDEIKANVGALTKKADYGRVNYYVGQAILAKLYLNSVVYTGAARWDDCIAACNEIINSNVYKMSGGYADNFSAANQTSTENIFSIPYHEIFAQGFNLVQMTLHYESQKTFNLASQPWNGYCTLAEFYNSFDATDLRREANFLAGPQFSSGGERLVDNQAEANDPDGKPLTFTPELNALEPNCLRQAGARVGKYRFKLGATPNLDNDAPLFRLADIYLTKVEANWRKAGAPASYTVAADLTDFNRTRVRAGLTPATSITAASLLAERGKEMFAEAWRRQDLIRFGIYTTAYGKFKTSTDPATETIFPIPDPQIQANSSLKQNPGYQ
jgi:starch-binding outer membrane protein, SusD/RagB family